MFGQPLTLSPPPQARPPTAPTPAPAAPPADRRPLVAAAIALAHLALAYAGAAWLAQAGPPSALHRFFEHVSLSGRVFFSQWFITGAVLYSLAAALWFLGHRPANPVRSVVGVFAVSSAVSVLLGADLARNPPGRGQTPGSISGLVYTLLTERQALLTLWLFATAAVAVGAYYLFRSFFAVEYTGSGIQIRLPGQTVYYMPIYPQISWQKTGIELREGEKVHVELSGYVSPGALQEITELQAHMDAFVKWQEGGSKPEEWHGLPQAPTWPYTGPCGYLEEWYGPTQKLEILEKHPIYKQDYFYRMDDGLTVKGLPHNKVLGIIRTAGEPEPRRAVRAQPAYDWTVDQERLLYLSSERYPLTIEAAKSGELWVVINDVDEARWDNGGMFFLKVTRQAWR